MSRMFYFRVGLLTCLLVAGVWLLTGCYYIGTYHFPVKEESIGPVAISVVTTDHDAKYLQLPNTVDYRELVGQRDSSKPIRPNTISKPEVIKQLGTPWLVANEGRTVAYVYIVKHSVWVHPLCGFQTDPGTSRAFGFRLDFDQDDFLKNVKIETQDDPDSTIHAVFASSNMWIFKRFNELADKLGVPHESMQGIYPNVAEKP